MTFFYKISTCIAFLYALLMPSLQATDGSRETVSTSYSIYKGSCYCNKVQFEAKGEPLFTQYCHCNKCRSIAAQSSRKEDKIGYSHTAAYMTKNFTLIKGTDSLEEHPVNNSYLYLCKHCKSLIYGISQDVTQQEGIGVNMSNFLLETSDLPNIFKATRHVYYADRLIDISDNLPKFIDFPIELGGSGKLYEPPTSS